MELTDLLAHYSRTPARNHLAFVGSAPAGLQVVDAGRELALWLRGQDLNSSFLEMEVNDRVEALLAQSCHDARLGAYRLLTNVGILFEPALKLNLHALVDFHSQRQLLVIASPGRVEQGHYCFLQPNDHYGIDLTGLSYCDLNPLNRYQHEI